MELEIRQEIEDDYKEVYLVNKLAFGQDDESRLVNLMRESDAFIPELSIVATINNKIVGHILFTKIKIIDTNHNEVESLALAPMAVLPEYQKQGIGGKLIKHGLHMATELHFKSVIVLGHELYYPKFGFIPAEKWGIHAPYDVSSNSFMAIELVKDGLKNAKGTVKYPKEFDTL